MKKSNLYVMNKLETFQTLLYKKSALLKCIFSTLLFQFLVTTLIVIYIYNHSDLFGYITKDGPSFLFLFLSNGYWSACFQPLSSL